MDDSDDILKRYRRALENARSEIGVPDVPSFSGTLLIDADDTQYHYADEWCRKDDVCRALERLAEFTDTKRTLGELALAGCEIDGDDCQLWLPLTEVAALLATGQHVRQLEGANRCIPATDPDSAEARGAWARGKHLESIMPQPL